MLTWWANSGVLPSLRTPVWFASANAIASAALEYPAPSSQ